MRAFLIAALGYISFATLAQAGVTYTYDTLGRLSTAAYDSGKTITYNYDPAGNRTQVATANTPHFAAAATPHAKAKKKHRH